MFKWLKNKLKRKPCDYESPFKGCDLEVKQEAIVFGLKRILSPEDNFRLIIQTEDEVGNFEQCEISTVNYVDRPIRPENVSLH
jgi:hypothetical protein